MCADGSGGAARGQDAMVNGGDEESKRRSFLSLLYASFMGPVHLGSSVHNASPVTVIIPKILFSLKLGLPPMLDLGWPK
jgi:hypothetical protein